jgi:elongator complex protein 3
MKLQKENENAKARIIGITIETRPDLVDLAEIKRLRQLGVTRVELGVQTIYDDILKLNKRGHTVKSTISATKMLKNNGFKVSYQVMPNLLGSTFKKDLKMLKTIFENDNFKPDALKIYPLALIKNTPLYKLFKAKKYHPYTKKQLIDLLKKAKKYFPRWVRVERVIRDIPSTQIEKGGSKVLNLREIVHRELKQEKATCLCVRCREVRGFQKNEKLYLFKTRYAASQGQEIFLSFENKARTRLYALLRLRLPVSKTFKAKTFEVQPRTWASASEETLKTAFEATEATFEVGPRTLVSAQGQSQILGVLKGAALIRELHTYGQATPIKKRSRKVNSVQNRGLGRKLIQEAEKIAQENNFQKIAIIAGVGVRGYYRSKLGYKLKDTYLVKKLTSKNQKA